MPTYPGTVKSFTSKVDQIDTVFAAHVNALQDEVTAIETILGPNPQGAATTVAARLSGLETGTVGIANPQTVTGAKTFSGPAVFGGTLRAGAGTMTGIGSTTHGFQIGADSSANFAFSGGFMQARNNGTPVDLTVQPYGGRLLVGTSPVWTGANQGPGSGMNADLVDGKQAAEFAPVLHKHPANFVKLTRSTALTVPNNVWTPVVFNTENVNYKDSGSDMYTMSNGHFITPPAVGPALYYLEFRCFFVNNSTGNRGVQFLDSNSAVIDRVLVDAGASGVDFVSLSGMYYYPGTSGFFITVQVYQSSGASLQVQANSTTTNFAVTWATLVRTSP